MGGGTPWSQKKKPASSRSRVLFNKGGTFSAWATTGRLVLLGPQGPPLHSTKGKSFFDQYRLRQILFDQYEMGAAPVVPKEQACQ